MALMAESSGISAPGKLSYIQIPAVDAEVSAAFYRDVFGWTIRGTPEHRSFSDATGELIGAWITGRLVHADAGILPYISVDDVDATIRRIIARGGTIAREPYPEGDLRVAHFRDSAGNLMGIWQMGGGNFSTL
jgi:hypothetical protein